MAGCSPERRTQPLSLVGRCLQRIHKRRAPAWHAGARCFTAMSRSGRLEGGCRRTWNSEPCRLAPARLVSRCRHPHHERWEPVHNSRSPTVPRQCLARAVAQMFGLAMTFAPPLVNRRPEPPPVLRPWCVPAPRSSSLRGRPLSSWLSSALPRKKGAAVEHHTASVHRDERALIFEQPCSYAAYAAE